MQNTLFNNDDLNQINNAAFYSTFQHFSNFVSKQMEVAKSTTERAITRADSLGSINTAEAALDFQRTASTEEITELKKSGLEYYKLGEEATRDFVKIAEQSQAFWQKAFGSFTNNAFPFSPQSTNVADGFSFAQKAFDNAQTVWQKNFDNICKGDAKDVQATVVEKSANRKK